MEQVPVLHRLDLPDKLRYATFQSPVCRFRGFQQRKLPASMA
ncbi:hypothetical protein SAMN04515617_11482 [Collimonas sp. OK242]|jgi:hypothetical protein|nr:hypothetical protein SAMN04515617_11482 [Collimonas sp. OK242]